MNRGASFLFRLKKDVKPHSRKKQGKQDWLAIFKKPKNCNRKDLPLEIILRFISFQPRGFRTIYLLSNLLDTEKYSKEEIIDLYFKRWQIETRYNELKNMIEIENLRSLDEVGINKEVIARVILSNLVRLVMLEASKKEGLHVTDLSYKKSLEKVINTALLMLNSSEYKWSLLYKMMIDDIRKMKIIKRTGRHYPRYCRRTAGLPAGELYCEVSYENMS